MRIGAQASRPVTLRQVEGCGVSGSGPEYVSDGAKGLAIGLRGSEDGTLPPNRPKVRPEHRIDR